MKKSLGNHHEVAHVWASQSQSEGYGSNMLFDGPSIYSYGKHFEIARIVRPGVVLFNCRSYSVSTSKHQSRARAAVSHMKVFSVPYMTEHDENVEWILKTLEADLLSITRKRKGAEFWLDQYTRAVESAWEYVALFKVRKALFNKVAKVYAARENPLTPEQLAKFKAQIATEKERAKAEKKEREDDAAALRAESQKDYDAWKAGANVARYTFDALPVALRIKDNEIQTSRGASVPVIEARKLWRVLRTDATQAIGMRVGHYTVDRIDPEKNALIVGCHTIPMGEIARMAVTLGFEQAA